MQELRSTEILDKEIQADARKKADKILKQADADCSEILNSVNVNIENAKAEKKEFYSKKIEACKNDLNASTPLEKERFKVAYIGETLIKYINDYLDKLSDEKKLELVCKDFDFEHSGKINAYVYGFDVKTVKTFLSKKTGLDLGKCEETKFGKLILEDDLGLKNPQGIILEAEDKSIRCRLTITEVINRLLDTNRAELADALFSK